MEEKLVAIKKFLDVNEITDVDILDEGQIDLLYEVANGIIKDEYGNAVVNNTVGLYYVERDEVLAERYLLRATECDGGVYADAFYNLADLYCFQDRKELAETYYLKAVELGDVDSMRDLAGMYRRWDKWDLAEKYYLMAVEKESVDAIVGLGNLYMDMDCSSLAEKYFIRGIEKTGEGYENLELLYEEEPLKLFNALIKLSNTNSYVEKKLGELRKIYSVRCFEKKMLVLGKYDTCSICLEEDKLLIPRECVHYYCLDCFVKIEKCAYCENNVL
ncbi:MAG: hypothetical protein Hyperionvirus12_3 [Hyperionvirus sp.]|uniref:RING-type domain-containing protein n=1 Tax=Hyperionvirus sp. TaxID=2487770 RepID=A0A3G5A950_9VIRU|nr:MAG: hypothetical protein Hyperionvirus12_3 [Hyperionvirus sp.]